jgi:hypothetical protein
VPKNSRFHLAVKAALLFSVLLAGVALRLGAQDQDNGAPAGGSWNVYDSQDKMTAAHRVRFELAGNSEQREARGPDARGPYDNSSGPGPGPRGPYDSRGPRGPRDAGPEPSQPRVEIYCENGSYKSANFYPGVRIAPPNRPGFWGQPQMEVLVRVNDSHSNHGWNWTPDFLSMDKNTTREMIGAQLFRVEFMSSRGPVIAEFSPTGLELGRVAKACGLKPKKP